MSRKHRKGPNQLLTEEQEAAVCQYFDGLHAIGTSA